MPVPNLFWIDSAAYCIKIAKEGTQLSGSEKVNKEHLPEVMSAVRATGTDTVLPKRMQVTYTLTVEPNAVPSENGSLLATFPRTDQRRQQHVKLLATSEDEYV